LRPINPAHHAMPMTHFGGRMPAHPVSFPLGRRRFLGGAALTLAAPALLAHAAPRFASDPFTLGVASGVPRPDGVVLWTRLAPEPLNEGGMPDEPVQVGWEIAEDDGLKRIVQRGTTIAEPRHAHSVHLDVTGLQPARWYWYRFTAGAAQSPVGRTRTAPAPDAALQPLRFAFASCQQYEQGYYAAYRHMAAEPLDLVVHLGDYIYEMSWGSRHVRKHETGIPTELAEFRNRYALYKGDPDLQLAHAAFPWLVTWDDHEVANDYTSDHSPVMADRPFFLRQRAAAYRAWWEHMPVSPALAPAALPGGPEMRIYGRHRFGATAEFLVLDGRQYRSAHACGRGHGSGNLVGDCAERREDARTMLGATQERWFDQAIGDARGRWTVVAQPTLMAELDRKAGPEPGYWMDGWDGYPAARRRLLDSIALRRPSNPVVIGGDVHSFWVADLRQDFARPESPVIASEIVGTSISSQGPSAENVRRHVAKNPHVRYGEGRHRGYVTMELGSDAAHARLRAVDDVKSPTTEIRTLASFAVENGKPGAQPA
jgi:alkaline phosphatase D